MSTQIEKETRLMITHEEYISICSDIIKTNPRVSSFNQTNYYFDNEAFDLTNNHRMVRIRNKGHDYELTYKEKEENGDLEINQIISGRLAHKYLHGGSLPHGEVYNAVARTGLSPKKLKVITSLYTRRIEMPYEDYLLVIDMNSYDDIEAKLSVICVRNQVSFELDKPKEYKPVTYNIDSTEDEDAGLPAWVRRAKQVEKEMNS